MLLLAWSFLICLCVVLTFSMVQCVLSIFRIILFVLVIDSQKFNIMNKVQFDFIVSVSSIVSELTQFPSEVADFIGCQFALESAYGESSIAHRYNNFCGMRNPMVRISNANHAGVSDYQWAEYDDLYSCVIDYLFCLSYRQPNKSVYMSIVSFSAFLRSFYCPDLDYTDSINKIYQQFKSFQS